MAKSTDYMTLKRAARELGVHEQTLRSWEKRGLIRLARLPGSGYRRVPVEEVKRIQDDMASPQPLPPVRLSPPQGDAASRARAQALAEAVCRDLASLEATTTYDEFMASRRGREWSP
jgi:transposase-like protein